MAGNLPSDHESPAGAPAEQKAVDRRWRLMATSAIVVLAAVAALIGFLVIPAGQRENAQLSLWDAICRAAGLSAGSPAQVQPLSAGQALPVSLVSWDSTIVQRLEAGSTQSGAQLAAATCAACHGEAGVSQNPNTPSLAGQTSYAIYKQLSDYRSGARVHPQMTGVAKALTVPDLASIAAHYAAASSQYSALGRRDLSGEEHIVKLAWEGDTRRRIPACMSCHANGVGGPIETPSITGQDREYMAAQMDAYASGARRNDVYGRMREISRSLTPEERQQLARYFQGTL